MKRRTKTLGVVAAIVIVFTTVAGFREVYFIREDTGGWVLWNTNQAYLFIGVSHRGFHMRCFQYPWVAIKQYLGAIESPVDDRGSLVVIRITSTDVEHYTLDNQSGNVPGPDLYTPVGDTIYANCPALGGLCRWDGDHFQRITKEEEDRFGGFDRLAPDTAIHANGWSKDGIAGGPQNLFANFQANVGGQFTVSEERGPTSKRGFVSISIWVQRQYHSPERVWFMDGHPRRVSKAEYYREFAGQP